VKFIKHLGGGGSYESLRTSGLSYLFEDTIFRTNVPSETEKKYILGVYFVIQTTFRP
jgi:hypothetical protein